MNLDPRWVSSISEPQDYLGSETAKVVVVNILSEALLLVSLQQETFEMI